MGSEWREDARASQREGGITGMGFRTSTVKVTSLPHGGTSTVEAPSRAQRQREATPIEMGLPAYRSRSR